MPLRSWRNYANINIRNPVFIIELLLIILLIAILYAVTSLRGVTAELRDSQTERISLSTQNGIILREIKSCTDPEGACAKRGAAQQLEAIQTINQISVYAAYCASVQPAPVSVTDVETCVSKQLESEK